MVAPTSLISVFAALLTLARIQQGMSQKELGAITGFADTQISRWERGVIVPDLPTLIRWADGLNFEVALVRRPEVS